MDVISGDPSLANAVVSAVKKWKYKPYIVNGSAVPVRTQMTYNFAFKGSVRDVKQTDPPPAANDGVPRTVLGAGVSQGLLIHSVRPVYPRDALKRHIQGTVLLKAVIGQDGAIKALTPLQGPPELIPAAIGAVQQWRYKPFVLGGEVMEVMTEITVNFRIAR